MESGAKVEDQNTPKEIDDDSINLTLKLHNVKGRKCYVDPHETFPQATFYLNLNEKRPKYNQTSIYNNNNNSIKKRKKNFLNHNSGNKLSKKFELDSDSESKNNSENIQNFVSQFPSSKKINNSNSNINDTNNNIDNDTLIDIDKPIKKSNKFGTWDGVFVSCLLNIFGVIMFLRLGFVVGQSGLMYSFLIILLSCVVVTLTTLSMAAIATNGEQRAGGAYYMISRTLGPAIGGAVGTLFCIGMAIAVSMYIIGFCETLVDNIGHTITGNATNDIRLYGFILLTVLFGFGVIGISWVIKLQFLLLSVLIVAILSFLIGSFFNYNDGSKGENIIGIHGIANGNLIDNLTPKFKDIGDGIKYDFFTCFGIFFPACTGIMAGANLSGDLKNPSHDIPVGTLAAIIVSTIIYLIMSILCAIAVKPDGLIYNYFIMNDISIFAPFIILGIYAATLSSALTSLVGAPRILLSVSKDNLIPFLKFFKITNSRGEPIRAYILTYTIALSCVFIGHLNIVAPLITQIFLGTYAFISFACYSMSISRSPGWRPSFIYYNKWTALTGGISCLGIMLFINLEYAVMAIILTIIIYLYIKWNKPNVNWGSAFESRAKWKANSAALTLYQYGDHVKNFQPSFLVLIKDPLNINDIESQSLIKFSRTLRHGFGVIVYSQILLGKFEYYAKYLSNRAYYIPVSKDLKKAAFFEQICANKIRNGARILLQSNGIGRLRTNTLVLGFKNNWTQQINDNNNNGGGSMDHDDDDDDDDIDLDNNNHTNQSQTFSNDDFVGLLSDCLNLKMGFMICRGIHNLNFIKKTNAGNIQSSGVFSSPSIGSIHNISQDDSSKDRSNNGDNHDNKNKNASEYFNEEFDEQHDNNILRSHIDELGIRSETIIDVWWLLDDGGLSLLVPHCMSLSSYWKKLSGNRKCKIRLFLVSEEDILNTPKSNDNDNNDNNKGDINNIYKINEKIKKSQRIRSQSIQEIQELARISRQGIIDDQVIGTIEDSTELWKEELRILMLKFRLNIIGPFTVKSGRSEPTQDTVNKFCNLTNYNWNKSKINGKYIKNNIKLKRWLRVSELIQAYSRKQKCCFITAPYPFSFPSSTIYLGVIDMLTRNNLYASILIRGSGQNCLTFYSE